MFAPKIIKIYQSFFKSQTIMLRMLFDVFFVFFNAYFAGSFFPGSAEADIG